MSVFLFQTRYKYNGNSGIKQPEQISLSIIGIVVNFLSYAPVI
ncbi:hypothetical protein PRABACTJOHN_02790 [Parabacteroides johnsonii DSM 18315]|uniref:Uncharacterized protein n=1 Tax=Parabacteroides johnsonii DSM 18315 TaxID=537006 RepID=B7BCM2_9BACT|nr:hypothetical protein PRABACTJOHN_02790 [Parabacteroides johnsonii DSM 18315]